jgi:hypothetical protein
MFLKMPKAGNAQRRPVEGARPARLHSFMDARHKTRVNAKVYLKAKAPR